MQHQEQCARPCLISERMKYQWRALPAQSRLPCLPYFHLAQAFVFCRTWLHVLPERSPP